MKKGCRKLLILLLVLAMALTGSIGTWNLQMAETVEAASAWDGTTASAWTADAAHDGTQAKPYLITSAENLAYLAQEVNKGTSYSGKYFQLTADLDLGGKEWTPIGKNPAATSTEPDNIVFAGTFDGNGHAIIGLSITKTVTENGYGLFGINTGTIQNLKVSGTITGSQVYAGLTAGINTGTITGCSTEGSINLIPASGTPGNYAGGIAGSNGTKTVAGTIRNCVNAAQITTAAGSWKMCGGIAGLNYAEINSCKNTGKITGLDAGGIVSSSYNYGNGTKISNCYNTGEIAGSNGDGAGIAASNGGAVKNCYNIGKITSTRSKYPDADKDGGIVSYESHYENYDKIGTYQNGSEENCYYLNTSVVSAAKPLSGIKAWTEAEMKSDTFTAMLGSAFIKDSASTNSGYPVLSWEGTAAALTTSTADLQTLINKVSADLDAVQTGTDAASVAKGSSFVTEAEKTALTTAKDTAVSAVNAKTSTSAELLTAYQNLMTAWESFLSAKKTGTKEIAQAAQTTISFTLYGDSKHGTAAHTAYPQWLSVNVTFTTGMNAWKVFQQAMNAAGYQYYNGGGSSYVYVTSVTTPSGLTLSAKDNGADSGWMYKINGAAPSVGMDSYTLKAGDSLMFYYVDTWKNDWTDASAAATVTPAKEETTPEFTVTKEADGTAAVTFAEKDTLQAEQTIAVSLKEEGFAAGQKVHVYEKLADGTLSNVAYGSTYTVGTDGKLTLPVMNRSDLVISAEKITTARSLRSQITGTKKLSVKKGAAKTLALTLPDTLQRVKTLTTTTAGRSIGALTVRYHSSNRKIAKVNAVTGRVTGLRKGSCTITAKITLYSGKTKTIKTKVTVK